MSNSNDMMQMEAHRRFMSQQRVSGRSAIPESQQNDAQRYHQDRPQGAQWPNNTPTDNVALFPPMCFLRKEIMMKLIFYGTDEEDGEKNKIRKYLLQKYKEMVVSLKQRLIKERLTLIKIDRLMTGNTVFDAV